MGKKSVRENKNVYQQYREEMGYTREVAGELMDGITADRLVKIEGDKSLPHPDEILLMAECYKKPELSNYFCSNVCPIGMQYVPEIEIKDLSQIILEVIASLNDLEKQKNRLIEIAVDGEINEDEYEDFAKIKGQLDKISLSISSLKLWVEKTMAEGKIEKDVF